MHPIRPTRYPIGHVYYEFYFYKSANGGAVSLFNVSHNILYRLSLTALYSYFTALTTCHGHRNNYSYAVSLHYKPWVVKYLSIFRDCGYFFSFFSSTRFARKRRVSWCVCLFLFLFYRRGCGWGWERQIRFELVFFESEDGLLGLYYISLSR